MGEMHCGSIAAMRKRYGGRKVDGGNSALKTYTENPGVENVGGASQHLDDARSHESPPSGPPQP